MLKIKKLLQKIALGKALATFSLTSVCTGILTLALILYYRDHLEWLKLETRFGQTLNGEERLIIFLAWATLGSAITNIAMHAHQWTQKTHVMLNIICGIFAIVFCFWPDKTPAHIVTLSTLTLMLIMALTIAPFCMRTASPGQFIHFNVSCFGAGILAHFAGTIFFLALALALFSLKTLFGLHIYLRAFGDLGVISFCLVTILVWLSLLTADFDKEINETKQTPEFLKVLALYIAPVILTAYAVILFAYIIKLGLNTNETIQKVPLLVGNFGFLAILTYLFSYPFKSEFSGRVATLRRWIFPALIIPSLVLAATTIQNIRSDGLTIFNYEMLLVAIGYIAIASYFIVAKQGSFKAPALLAILLLTISIAGPISATTLSENAQINRLVEAATQANMIDKQGKMTAHPENQHISQDVFTRITSSIKELKNNHGLEKLKTIFPENSILHKQTDQPVTPEDIFTELKILPPTEEAKVLYAERHYLRSKREKDYRTIYDLGNKTYLINDVYLDFLREKQLTIKMLSFDQGTLSIIANKQGITTITRNNNNDTLTIDTTQLKNILQSELGHDPQQRSDLLPQSVTSKLVMTGYAKTFDVTIVFRQLDVKTKNRSSNTPIWDFVLEGSHTDILITFRN